MIVMPKLPVYWSIASRESLYFFQREGSQTKEPSATDAFVAFFDVFCLL